MDFILMDIKNFLKKLENGQLEIEAGQWELHRDITNMRKMVNELKNLKDELGKMRMSSLQQMGLIKELQDRFNVLGKRDSEDHSGKDSACGSENAIKEHHDPETAEEYGKGNCHTAPSDDILEIASQSSKVKSDLVPGDSDLGLIDPQGVDEEDVELTVDRLNSCSETSENCYRGKTEASVDRLSSPHYITSSTNQDILHRYLQDSAKYLSRKRSGSIEIAFEPSITTVDEQEFATNDECPSFECDDCSLVLPADSDGESQESKTKMSSLWKRKPESNSHPLSKSSKKCPYKILDRRSGKRQRMSDKAIYCKTCGKDFSDRARLKKHTITHWMAAAGNKKGFKCSYCKKMCPTPETLTQHLRKCRIITKSYHRMK